MVYKLFNCFSPLEGKINRYQNISFDIFDTLIVRKCGNPHNVFDIVESIYNNQNQVTINNYRKNRIIAEVNIRQCSCSEEISLEQIYSELSNYYDDEVCAALKAIELNVELEQCIQRKDIVDLYKTTILSKNVVIISDMYLPYDFIVKVLKKNDIPLPKALYVSSEYNKTKRVGSLYKLMLEQQKIEASEILHIGDNLKSDFIRPKLLGMGSFWLNKK